MHATSARCALRARCVVTEDWVSRQNIQRFERELSHEAEPAKRAMLRKLLAEERGRLSGKSDDRMSDWRDP
jgi:hypothetical protein